jgi:hypothetical protein
MAGIEDVNRYPVIHTWSYKGRLSRPHLSVPDWRGIHLEMRPTTFAVAEHVEIIVIPLAGRARSRSAFEDQIVLFHFAVGAQRKPRVCGAFQGRSKVTLPK